MAPLIINGVSGGAPNRLEINDFIKDEKFFSLYIQALQAMYDADQNDRQSFFQISAIHGAPFQPWDDVIYNPATADDVNKWGGYCTHESVIFPTWHRPYMSLFEQTLHQHAEKIAARYTVDKEDWKKAALNLRQPFWDWAVNAILPDEVIELKQVTITGPDGCQIKVNNPFLGYKFHPIPNHESFGPPHGHWQTTLRHPTSPNADATDDIPRLKKKMTAAQNLLNIKTDTYTMLTRTHKWEEFSNSAKTAGKNLSNTDSLEAIHDDIHELIGGERHSNHELLRGEKLKGHMNSLAFAAFDPIFYLHHANVDRLLSLWAAMNPGVWVTPGKSGDGSRYLEAEKDIDETTALTPFWNTETTFWASAGLEDTSKLGYTYPDFNGLDMGNTDAVKDAISDKMDLLYNDGRVVAARTAKVKSVQITETITLNHDSEPTPQVFSTQVTEMTSPSIYFAPSHLWDWTVRIEYKMHELGTSFHVFIFLGEVPEDSEDWDTCSSYVGSAFAFVNDAAKHCANCTNHRDIVLEEFVHLDHAIARLAPELGSFDPHIIEPYLSKDLQWRVQKSNGELVQLESLEVSVLAVPLSYPPGAKFPVPGEPHLCNGITHGKSGGCRHA